MHKDQGRFWNLKGDLSAGLVVFLIAVPLCLGIALASGAPLYAGIVSGIVGGLVVGLLSKSNLSVTGPAAGLTAIVLAAVTELKAYDIFVCAVIIAGGVQLLLGILRAGAISNYFPSNVIEGMLAAIGVIIILKQLPYALGYSAQGAPDTGMEDDGHAVWSVVSDAVHAVHPGVLIVTLVSIGLLILWQRPAFKKLQLVPGALVAVIAGTVLNEVFGTMGSSLYVHAPHLVSLPVPNSFNEFLHQFTLPNFQGFLNPAVWQTGVVIAIVASIETLLCIEATDKLDPLKRYTCTNHELRAQGIGNIISGLMGGMPMTSVIVRSSANINAGGRTKLASMFHGALLLVCAALIPALLNRIPLATLAAILIFTGYRLCRPAIFVHMWKDGGFKQFIPFLVTVVAVVATNLLEGVLMGIAVSIVFILHENMKVSYRFQRAEHHSGDVIRLCLAQEVSFLNKAAIKATLNNLPENSIVSIDASHTSYIDHDVLTVIKEFQKVRAPQENIRLSLIGFKSDYKISNTEPAIHEEGAFKGMPPICAGGTQDELLRQLTKS